MAKIFDSQLFAPSSGQISGATEAMIPSQDETNAQCFHCFLTANRALASSDESFREPHNLLLPALLTDMILFKPI